MTRRLTVIFLSMLLTLGMFAQKRPKVGVVLSGGGAKGFSHVGVLKVLEEVGIPVDYVGGTSIGSIIAGLYAVGYNAADIEKMIHEQDWSYILSDDVDRGHIPYFEKQEMDRYNLSLPFNHFRVEVPNSFVKGQNVINTFTALTYGYHNVHDFSQFKIPFLCVAADLETGNEVVLDHGYLPFCMKASMAIPGVFKPQVIDGKMLVDGGIINNFPVDRVKEMGADIIIGVDLSAGLKEKEELSTIGGVMDQLISVMGLEKYEKNKKLCDIYINPDLHEFGASSFSSDAADTMLIRGEMAARSVINQLEELRDLLGFKAPENPGMQTPNPDTLMYLRSITFEGDAGGDELFLSGKLGLHKGTYVSLKNIENGIANIYGTLNYELVNYRITGNTEKNLVIYLIESSRNTFNLGVHYDNVNHAALLLNTTFRRGTGSGARLSTNLKLSRQPGFDSEYTVDRGMRPGFHTGFEVRSINFKILDDPDEYIVNFDYGKIWVGTHFVVRDKFTFGLNASFQKSVLDEIYSNTDTTFNQQDYHLGDDIQYRFFVNYDNRDNVYYPTRGVRLSAEFKVVTDNLIQYQDMPPILTANFTYQKAIRLWPRLSLHPMLSARTAYFEGEMPFLYRTFIGGTEQTDYFSMQVPFYGIRFLSFPTIHFASAALRLDYEFLPKHHVGGLINSGVYSNEQNFTKQNAVLIGGGLNYSYDSLIGPIDVWLTASNEQSDLYTFVSLGYWF